ncbi:MAG: IS630 family transposase, partial [Candidatus Methanoperedenaceae archaeon]|nr:IS630 family transposase [Candidatus Methanoperedenaceae archaeon]
MKKYIVTLSKEERAALKDITCKGTHSSQQVLNAHILPGVDEVEHQVERLTNEEIARVHVVSMRKIEAHLIALSCSEPPEGYARWSLRLLADKSIEPGFFER